MFKAEFLAVVTRKIDDEIREELLPVARVTNPTLLPTKGDTVNLRSDRFLVTGIEWFPYMESVNVYLKHKGE